MTPPTDKTWAKGHDARFHAFAWNGAQWNALCFRQSRTEDKPPTHKKPGKGFVCEECGRRDREARA